jgi:hypothetical protein
MYKKYKIFKWDSNDFPGGPLGPNEKLSRQMASDLAKPLHERRVNTGDTAILTAEQVKSNPELLDYV